MLSERKELKSLMDIGAYYNPINLFMDPGICLESLIIIEPILDATSAYVPCPLSSKSDPSKSTHVLILPITFRHYMSIRGKIPMPDTIVCIGCDGHYGPNKKMLETAFKRPYALYLEFPSDYVHSIQFRKMNGEKEGEMLGYINKFEAKTNETIYTKRVMKVIEYLDPSFN